MRLATRILLGLLVIGSIWVLWLYGAGDDGATVEPRQPTGYDGRLFTTPLPESTTPKKTAKKKETTSETPAEVKTAQKPQTKLEKKRFYRVVVRDGGTLEAGGTVIALDGIVGKNADARCTDSHGKEWSCGTRARVALVRLIRGRAVTCQLPASANPSALTARCTVGGTDLSLWMVLHGWAKPKDPATTIMAKAAEAARKKKAGLWR